MLHRNVIHHLNIWKSKTGRLPLILRGARQVGKTTVVEAFGAASFPKTHTFNFQKNLSLHAAFRGDLNPPEILKALELSGDAKINPQDLLFFDEIQDCPEALTSLKYFAETLPQYAIIAAGSYLGLMKNEHSFPVGKVDFQSLYPMSFFEFLKNLDPQTHDYFAGLPVFEPTPLSDFYHNRALGWLRTYFCVGGMPAVVQAYATQRGYREIQTGLISGYHGDFTKHSGMIHANHILRVFESSATQLGQARDESVGRFKFTGVIPRKKGFEAIDGPLTWLEKSRLVIKAFPASRFEQPMKAFTRPNIFKVYLLDVGLLNAMLGVPVEAIMLGSLGSYKGYIAENFVAQELFAALDQPLLGWSEGASEVEFVVSRGAHLCPIEVKASSRFRRSKSLDALIDRYHPELSIKLTGENRSYHHGKKVFTLPIYLAEKIFS